MIALFAFLTACLLSVPALAQVGAWQGTVVLDKNNKTVGNVIGPNEILLLSLSPFLDLGPHSLGKNGFLTNGGGTITNGFIAGEFFYQSFNCTGTPYMEAQSFPIRGFANDAGTGVAEGTPSASIIVYHPLAPYQVMSFNSVYFNITTEGAPGCYATTGTDAGPLNAGLVTSETITFTPPFHLNTN